MSITTSPVMITLAKLSNPSMPYSMSYPKLPLYNTGSVLLAESTVMFP